MLISVVIPTYKRHDTIENAINCVLSQTYTDFEIIIVDDNGKDTDEQKMTENVVEKYLGNIKYIICDKNKGVCSARNIGISNASGEIIAFLDDDDFWCNDYLGEIHKMFENGSNIVYTNHFILRDGILYENGIINPVEGDVHLNLLDGFCPASTSLVSIRKKCFVRYGGFDEDLKNYEEYDLWIRLSQFYEFDYCDSTYVIKDDSEHSQLTNSYYSRLLAIQKMQKKWFAILDEEKKELFSQTIKAHISYNYKMCKIVGVFIDNDMNYSPCLNPKDELEMFVGKIIGIGQYQHAMNWIFKRKRRAIGKWIENQIVIVR